MVEIMTLMLADKAAQRPDGKLEISGAGGVMVCPPHLPDSYRATWAGIAYQRSDDGPTAQLLLQLLHPGEQTGVDLAGLNIGFVPSPDPAFPEPIATSFAVGVPMDLFNEGVHHLLVLQQKMIGPGMQIVRREVRRLPFLVKIAA